MILRSLRPTFYSRSGMKNEKVPRARSSRVTAISTGSSIYPVEKGNQSFAWHLMALVPALKWDHDEPKLNANGLLLRALLHPVVIRAAATLGWNPGNDLVGVLNVAGFAVHAVRGIQADALAIGRGFVVHHLVDVRGAEVLARAAELFHAPVVTDVGVLNQQMRGLIFFVLGAGMIEVGEFVEG